MCSYVQVRFVIVFFLPYVLGTAWANNTAASPEKVRQCGNAAMPQSFKHIASFCQTRIQVKRTTLTYIEAFRLHFRQTFRRLYNEKNYWLDSQ